MLPALALKFVKSKLKLVFLIPLVVSLTAFIVALICTLAGQNKGILEELAVLRVNTSQLGYFLVDTNNNTSSSGSGDNNSLFESLKDKAGDVIDAAEDKLKEISNDVANKLAEELGISQWYSLHLTSVCQGDFKDASKPGSGTKTTNCTELKINSHFNITEELSKELSVGPLNFTLSDLGFTDSFSNGITRQLRHLTTFLAGIYILFIVGSIGAGVSIGFSVVCIFNHGIALLRLGTIASGVSFVSLLLGTMIATLATTQIAQTLTDFGDTIGVAATAGKLWIHLAFSAVAMMGTVFVIFFIKFRSPQIKAAAGNMKDKMKDRVKNKFHGGKEEEYYSESDRV